MLTKKRILKRVLISSFDMEIGGVERSLIGMLENFDCEKYAVDLLLYRHQGDFMNLLPQKINLLEEIPQYATFRKSIFETLKDSQYSIGLSRIFSKIMAEIKGNINKIEEPGYYQMQLMWKYALSFLPKVDKEYDIAISYLWPHYFVADKVKAKKKIAWIHTDYSAVSTDVKMDLKMWEKFDYIISISDDCTGAFLSKYPELKDKIVLIENMVSSTFIKRMAKEQVNDLFVGNNHFNIVSVGRLSYAKGFDNAVKALKLLHDRGFRNIKWYVVGYGGDEAMLKELIAKNKLEKSFILLGKKTNPYPYIKNCGLYVQPSRYEGKAVTVTEAKILGKPILITDYPTAQSQLNDGVDGVIIELSVEGIANGIEELYKNSNLRNQLANNCKSTNYSNNFEMKKLYNILK